MQETYTTGQFAKLAGVSVRTVRYYDQIHLLTPSFHSENGYRRYGQNDLIRLQKITTLKYLGFSLNEIQLLLEEEKPESMDQSLETQITLLEQKIRHMQVLKESLLSAQKMLKRQELNWSAFRQMANLHAQDEKILAHYRNANHLSIRIRLHDMYSQNKQGWFPWLFSHIDFDHADRLLELGCGNGALWRKCPADIRQREIFLSDLSQGMIDFSRQALGDEFNYMTIDCQNIPFKKHYFDAVIANHMLFYLNDLHQGLKEIRRVCKREGKFYCTTYGEAHMREISELVRHFDDRIYLNEQRLSDRFGLENGEAILKQYFQTVRLYRYEDALSVDDPQAIMEYIMSCHGNQNDILAPRINEFKSYLNARVKNSAPMKITKDAGLFICEGACE